MKSARVALLLREILSSNCATGRVRSLGSWLGVNSYAKPADRYNPTKEFVLQLTSVMLDSRPTNAIIAVMLVKEILYIIEMYTADEVQELTAAIKEIYERQTTAISN